MEGVDCVGVRRTQGSCGATAVPVGVGAVSGGRDGWEGRVEGARRHGQGQAVKGGEGFKGLD